MLWLRKHPKRKGTLSSLGARCWLTVALLLPTAAANAAQKRVALIIGNSGYVHMSGRSNSKQDAANISGALDGLGFQVITAYDLDKAGFDTRTAEFGRALAGADVGVFFFAGRGVQIAGRNYLVPIDAQSLTVQKLDALTVPLDLVYALLEGRAKTKILLIDADRNNSLTTDSADPKSKETRALAIPKMGVGTLISFSTQPGNVALEGSGGNSPYVAALLRRITIAGQDLAGLLDAVRNDVRTATNNKQIPWYQSSLQEKFYFVQSSPTK
jgi:uncharacterized caspase-like protein